MKINIQSFKARYNIFAIAGNIPSGAPNVSSAFSEDSGSISSIFCNNDVITETPPTW